MKNIKFKKLKQKKKTKNHHVQTASRPTYRQVRLDLAELGVPPGLEDEQAGVDLAHRQLARVQLVLVGHQQVQQLLRLQRPDVADRVSQFVVRLVHFVG